MVQLLIIFVFFVIAFLLFGLALHFSKYKKRESGCCGGGHCDTTGDGEHVTGGCYHEKLDFVENYKTDKGSCGSSCTCER